MNVFLSSSKSIVSMLVRLPEPTFDFTPPPTKYDIVNSPVGDCPYDLVFKKFAGSNDEPNLSIEEFNPKPTFLKLGIKLSSEEVT